MHTLTISSFILLMCFKNGLGGYCDQHTIPFSGILKNRTRFYLDGESFLVACEKGYKSAVANGRFTCNNGVWNGHFPPCVPGDCRAPPPSVPNGRIKSFSSDHSSKVEYECDQHYVPIATVGSGVQCLFGEWKGEPPTCKDSRCYLTDLKKKDGVSSLLNPSTLDSGQLLVAVCDPGYQSTAVKPVCVRGEWTEYGTPPCTEANCTVGAVPHGKFVRPKEKRIWRWDRLNFERRESFKTVDRGTTKPPGTILYIKCDSGYVFRGNGPNNDTTMCQKGNWAPNADCRK